MKSQLITFGLILMVAISFAFHFTNEKKLSQEVFLVEIYFDKTDSTITQPTFNDIRHLLKIDGHKWARHIVRFRVQTEIIQPLEYDVVLNSGSPLNDTHDFREKEIAQFLLEIKAVLKTIDDLNNNRDYSPIFSNVMTELRELSKIQATDKQFHLYTNLRENTEIIRLYEPDTIKSLISGDDSFIQEYFRIDEFFNAEGIKVTFHYVATGYKDSDIYHRLLQIYSDRISQLGAETNSESRLQQ